MWGFVIFILTSLPGTVVPELPSYLDLLRPDKLLHIFMFGIFFFLIVKGFRKEGNPPAILRHPVLYGFLAGGVIAAGTEILQALAIPYRTGSLWDFLANIVGCFLGFLFLRLFTRNSS